ncbi:MAG TPA: hypothetical protein VL949_08915 [Geobacteraceae bacterium]|nr:hypothetical protein [Geobacteraceae bacterium]
MKSRINSDVFTRSIRITLGIFSLLAAVALATPHTASAAGTAANAKIVNTVTVNYKDLNNTPQAAVTSSTTVTVLLVKSAPNLAVNTGAKSTDAATPATYTYTVTATNNGPDSYTVNQGTITYNPASGVAATSSASSNSFNLGASSVAAAAAAGASTITVPGDGVSGSAVNGIQGGSTIVIGTNAYSVSSVTNTGGATATITITGTLAAAINIGDAVYEQKTFTETVTPGTITVTTDPTITVPVTVTNSASSSSAQVSTVTTVHVPNLSVNKEVSSDDVTYGKTASQAPGQTVYYRITVTNNGTSAASNVVITDPLTIYTSYANGSGKLSTTAGQTYSAAPTALTEGSGGYSYTAGTGITYNAGSLAASSSVVLYFKATIN